MSESSNNDSSFLVKRDFTTYSDSIPSVNNSTNPSSANNQERNQSIESHSSLMSLLPRMFKDPIHRSICMESLCLRIIDTPEFQRLHYLKQLGTCDYVFRSAHHTRFEHSLGVAHLAEKLLESISSKQPYLGITKEDIQCVKVAGLCHDLGHGPFSHLFEGRFMKQILKKRTWKHEEGSINLFLHLLQRNQINLSDYDLNDRDKTFIIEVISGTPTHKRIGRDSSKSYLYDIVNNTLSGLDVDKLDYFQRDLHYTKAVSSDFDRFIHSSRVLPAEPIKKTASTSQQKLDFSQNSTASAEDSTKPQYPLMICYPEKLVGEAVDVFGQRYRMHQEVYMHTCVKKVELMIGDALLAANDHIRIKGDVTNDFPDGLYKLSECPFHMSALANLNDGVLYMIRNSSDPNLKESQDILDRIYRRQLYSCLGKVSVTPRDPINSMSEDDIAKEICNIANSFHKLDTIDESNELEENQNHPTGGLPTTPQSGQHTQAEVNRYSGTINLIENEEDDNDDHDGLIMSQDSIFMTTVHKQNMKTLSSYPQPTSNPPATSYEVTKHDIIVEQYSIHYGMNDQNPVDFLRFFKSKEFEKFHIHMNSSPQASHTLDAVIPELIKKQVKGMKVDEKMYEMRLPRIFEDRSMRIFCRNPAKEIIICTAFIHWSKQRKLAPYLGNTPQRVRSHLQHSHNTN